MNTRPKTYTIAAILWFLSSAAGVVVSIPALSQGATAFNQTTIGPPYVVVLVGMLLNAMGLVSAYGVWRNQKWGVILTIILSALNGLLGAPGILFAPVIWVRVFAGSGVVFMIMIIALLLWPKPKSATIASQPVRP
jgi:hypothetical protein